MCAEPRDPPIPGVLGFFHEHGASSLLCPHPCSSSRSCSAPAWHCPCPCGPPSPLPSAPVLLPAHLEQCPAAVETLTGIWQEAAHLSFSSILPQIAPGLMRLRMPNQAPLLQPQPNTLWPHCFVLPSCLPRSSLLAAQRCFPSTLCFPQVTVMSIRASRSPRGTTVPLSLLGRQQEPRSRCVPCLCLQSEVEQSLSISVIKSSTTRARSCPLPAAPLKAGASSAPLSRGFAEGPVNVP